MRGPALARNQEFGCDCASPSALLTTSFKPFPEYVVAVIALVGLRKRYFRCYRRCSNCKGQTSWVPTCPQRTGLIPFRHLIALRHIPRTATRALHDSLLHRVEGKQKHSHNDAINSPTHGPQRSAPHALIYDELGRGFRSPRQMQYIDLAH